MLHFSIVYAIRHTFKTNHLPIEGPSGCVGVAAFAGGLDVVVVIGVDSCNDHRNQTNKLYVYYVRQDN